MLAHARMGFLHIGQGGYSAPLCVLCSSKHSPHTSLVHWLQWRVKVLSFAG